MGIAVNDEINCAAPELQHGWYATGLAHRYQLTLDIDVQHLGDLQVRAAEASWSAASSTPAKDPMASGYNLYIPCRGKDPAATQK